MHQNIRDIVSTFRRKCLFYQILAFLLHVFPIRQIDLPNPLFTDIIVQTIRRQQQKRITEIHVIEIGFYDTLCISKCRG